MNEPTPILRYTDEALATLRELAKTTPELWRREEATDFQQILIDHHIANPVEDTGLVANGPITMPMPQSTHLRQRTDAEALRFFNNIPGLNADHLSDPRMISWLSCVHLQAYGQARWTTGPNRSMTRWVDLHYLAAGGNDLTCWSAAGRPLWMALTALKAEEYLSSLSAQQIVEHFSRNPEHYHACMEFQIMRSPNVMAEYTMALMTEAEGIAREGARELARENNRYAGSRVIATLPQTKLREINNETVDQLMRNPDYVNDRSKMRGLKPLQVLGLGAGVQSTAMALMADRGYMGLEKPDLAIFADTGWEPKAVYENVKWLQETLSYPVHVVSSGNIKTNTLSGSNPQGRKFIDMPVYTLGPDGTKGVASRTCTRLYKMEPIYEFLRAYLGMEPKKRAPKTVKAEMWLGITTDEVARTKNASRKEWIQNKYPFIEMDISRAQLYQWLKDNYPQRILPKSACIGCPYHTDRMWAEMQKNDPESFQDAVHVDWALRNIPACTGTLNGLAYLHKARVPLSELDFTNSITESEAMDEECDGLCHI